MLYNRTTYNCSICRICEFRWTDITQCSSQETHLIVIHFLIVSQSIHNFVTYRKCSSVHIKISWNESIPVFSCKVFNDACDSFAIFVCYHFDLFSPLFQNLVHTLTLHTRGTPITLKIRGI